MTNYTGNRKLSPEQAERLGKIIYLVQELHKVANAEHLGPTFNITPQGIQRHVNKNKKGNHE